MHVQIMTTRLAGGHDSFGLVEKPEDDTGDGLEDAVKQGTVIEEEVA